MMNAVLRYVVVLAVLAVGDALWLSYFAKAVFRPTLGDMVLDTPRWTYVVLFYLLYAAGILVFAVPADVRDGSWLPAMFTGALFGFFAYMTYDLTNLATIRAWTLPLALLDIGWGTVLTALAALAGYLVRSGN